MAITITPESFLNVVKQSGLIEQDQLKRLLREFKAQGGALDDSRTIADELVARKALTRWQADKLLRRRHKGFFLGKYRLLSLLGKGGMSSVYLAEHVLMRRRCAIKVLPSKRVRDSSYLARFHREAQAVASLDHPNIVRAYDVDKESDLDKEETHFLVMEYVQGRDLQEIVAQDGPQDFVDSADFVRQAAEGLEHAHQAGMVHRDIKPGNLLVDTSGVVKILDLGLARFFGDQEEESLTVTHDEKVLGTADYLAPEQALDSHSVDARADIYSLGCTFYFLLTGHPPFTEGTLAQRLMCHQNKLPPPIERDRPETPPTLVAIVNRAMAKKPRDRFQSAEEVSEALAAWLVQNAGDEWRLKHPALIGIGSGLGIDAAASATAVGHQTEPLPPAQPAQNSAPAPAEPPNVEVSAPAASAGSLPAQPPVAIPIARVQPAEIQVPGQPAEASDDSHLATFLSGLQTKEPPSAPSPIPSPVEASSAESPPANIATPAAPIAEPIEQLPVATPANAQPQTQSTGEVPQTVPVAAPIQAVPLATQAVPTQPPQVVPTATPAEPARVSDTVGLDVSAAETETFTQRKRPGRSRRSNSEHPLARMLAPLTQKLAGMSKRQKSTILAAVAGLITAVGAFGTYTIFFADTEATAKQAANGNEDKGTDNNSANTQGDGPREKHVELPRELTVGPNGAYKTINQALTMIRKHYEPIGRRDFKIVKISGGPYRENIVLDNSDGKESWKKGIRLVAHGDSPVVLEPTGDGPIVRVNKVDGFELEGFELRANGNKVAIEISGSCWGTQLKRLKISGFSETGVLGVGVSGSDVYGNEVVFEELIVEGGGNSPVGMTFKTAQSNDTSALKILRCRFLGPMSAGIVFEGTARFTDVRETIFAGTGVGLRFGGTEQVLRGTNIANNTFFDLDRGIVFDEMPSKLTDDMTFCRNLFFNMRGPEAVIAKEFNEQAFASLLKSVADNWTNRTAAAEGTIDLFHLRGKRDQSIKVVSTTRGHQKFLSCPQKRLPSTKDELKPYVGAVPP